MRIIRRAFYGLIVESLGVLGLVLLGVLTIDHLTLPAELSPESPSAAQAQTPTASGDEQAESSRPPRLLHTVTVSANSIDWDVSHLARDISTSW